MKLVNNTILSYMNFNICTTKFTTAIHINKPTRQILLCSFLKSLIFKEIYLSQILSAVYRLVTTLSGRYTIKISHILGFQRFLLSKNMLRLLTLNKTKQNLTENTPAQSVGW